MLFLQSKSKAPMSATGYFGFFGEKEEVTRR
jgi:hypothetical protein